MQENLFATYQNSQTKEIDAALRQSVVRLVRKERREINTVLLEGVSVDNTVGSLAKLSDAVWFGDAVRKHTAGECLDVFKVYIVGQQIMEEDRMVFLTFANVWNLLNIFRAVGSGYAVQLHGDVKFKASKAALNKLNLASVLTCLEAILLLFLTL